MRITKKKKKAKNKKKQKENKKKKKKTSTAFGASKRRLHKAHQDDFTLVFKKAVKTSICKFVSRHN